VEGDDWYIPVTQNVDHPVHILSTSPLVYEYARPISGTYALWYDLSYWHDGVTTSFNWPGQVAAILRGLRRYGGIVLNTFMQLNFSVALLILFALSPSLRFIRSALALWPVLILAISALTMYALVVVEYRYVAPFLLLLWLACFGTVEASIPRKLARIMVTVVAVSTVVLAFLWLRLSRTPEAFQYPQTVTAMQRLGFNPGDQLAVIGTDPAGLDAAYIARLGRMKIIAELRNPSAFWSADRATQNRVIRAFTDSGARAIITRDPLKPDEWTHLGITEYWVYVLRKPN
jgi:hypothetical protein